MNADVATLPAFAGYGIELEYMIVERDDLAPLPIADQLLRNDDDAIVNQVERGLLGWSNEMALHLIEIKNPRPVAALSELASAFQIEVRYLNHLLSAYGARLMPSAMHPWMDPRSDTFFWPHEHADIYQSYNRIFDCRSHGWANLQSMHVNLPFADDEQFARLHAAVRLLLPILPALAASSPIADGGDTGFSDYRMEAYRNNAENIPSIAGPIIPPTVSSRAEYEEKILAPMYRAIAPHDPQRILQHEWLNSHGAIARFERNAIEIRVLDTQECPQADLAIAAAAVAVVRALYDSGAATLAAQQAIGTDALADIFLDCIRAAEQATVDNAEYLALLGFPGRRCTAHQLWRHLIEKMRRSETRPAAAWQQPLQVILEQGPLARRILHAVGGDYSRRHLETIYRRLCDCLQQGRMFAV